MIILPSVTVVPIGNLRQIGNSVVRLLEDRHAQCHIVGRTEILSIFVFEVLFADVSEQLCVVGSEVAGDKGVKAIGVLLNDLGGDRFGVACGQTFADDEVGVYEPGLLFLEGGIEHFEHLSADQFVIAVDYHQHLIAIAVLHPRLSDIPHRVRFLLVSHHFIPSCL